MERSDGSTITVGGIVDVAFTETISYVCGANLYIDGIVGQDRTNVTCNAGTYDYPASFPACVPPVCPVPPAHSIPTEITMNFTGSATSPEGTINE